MFVFPMLGASSRFKDAGYSRPKYMLPLFGMSLFHHVVRSFTKYFDTDDFLFISRNDPDEIKFISDSLEYLGVAHRLVTTEQVTNGQAHTVALGLNLAAVHRNEELYIFNIDTILPDFTKPISTEIGDAWLEVFHGSGDHWSFVLPGEEFRVLQTSEKNRISNLCSVGLYYFRHRYMFDEAYHQALKKHEVGNGELYIAPLYNYLISNGVDVRYRIVPGSKVLFCGTPQEYTDASESSDMCIGMKETDGY